MIAEIDRRIREAVQRLRLLVDFVSDIKFTDDGTFTGTGIGDSELEGSVAYHFGFYSKPKDGARGLVVKADGQGNTSILVGWRDVQYEMSLQKGECGMQNAFGASVLLDKDGNAKVDAKDGSDTVVNGGSLKVARRTDAVKIGTLAGSTPLGGGVVTFVFTPVDADGIPTTPVGSGTAVDIFGVISGGAAHFKG